MVTSRYAMGKLLPALVAVFTFGALATASASASEPEFVPKTAETFPISIGNAMHAGFVSFSWPSMTWGTCSESKTAGTITGAKSVSLSLEWAHCSSGWHTEGSPEGHVVLTGTGTLTYVSRSAKQVGIVLAIKEAKLLSGGTTIKLRGSLVIPISPLNTQTTKFALPVHTTGLGEQEFSSYENENREVIEARPQIEFGGAFKKAGIEVEGTNELTTNKQLTVSTVTSPPAYLSSFGSEGTGNGQFRYPRSVAVAPSGNVYVADTFNNRVEEFSAAGEYVRQWGSEGSGNGQFNRPDGLGVATNGNVYVTEEGNDRVQEFTASGEYVTKWGSTGKGTGQFEEPQGVAVAGNGNLYVADSDNNRVQKFTASGGYVTQWGSQGTENGQFWNPKGLAVSPTTGNVYVTDEADNRVQEFSPTGTYIAKWGSEGKAAEQFRAPRGIAIAANGNVYVADEDNQRVQEFASNGEYLTMWGSEGNGNGQFSSPSDVAVAPGGDVYVVDKANNRIQKFG